MKKILFLMGIAITIQFSLKAQTTTCPGYSFKAWIDVDNKTSCDVGINIYVVDRGHCGSQIPNSPFWSITVPAGVSASYPLPAGFLAAAGNPYNNVIMGDVYWTSCPTQKTSGIEVDGPNAGSNCWSCGPYVAPGVGNTAYMPSCGACESTTAKVEWDSFGGLVIYP